MIAKNHLGQAVLGDVGVDLGGGDVGVAEQGLDHAQIGPAFQQMGGEGMAQHMRADPGRIEAGDDRRLLQKLGEPAPGEAPRRATRWEQPRTGLAAAVKERRPKRQIGLHRRAGAFAQRGQSLLAALALDDEVGRIGREGGQGEGG